MKCLTVYDVVERLDAIATDIEDVYVNTAFSEKLSEELRKVLMVVEDAMEDIRDRKEEFENDVGAYEVE